jgi:hypothetical protein
MRDAAVTLSTACATCWGQRGAWIRYVVAVAPRSGNADIVRASQLQHAVEGMHSYVDFSHPTFVRT